MGEYILTVKDAVDENGQVIDEIVFGLQIVQQEEGGSHAGTFVNMVGWIIDTGRLSSLMEAFQFLAAKEASEGLAQDAPSKQETPAAEAGVGGPTI